MFKEFFHYPTKAANCFQIINPFVFKTLSLMIPINGFVGIVAMNEMVTSDDIAIDFLMINRKYVVVFFFFSWIVITPIVTRHFFEWKNGLLFFVKLLILRMFALFLDVVGHVAFYKRHVAIFVFL